jgi:excinuclease ABC subunit A
VPGESTALPYSRNKKLTIIGASEHNLKNISVTIPRNTLTVITGLSGSGKSSLAFDTIYAEGQRRYVESLSAYARQFLDQMPKPKVEHIEGLSPAISIEQRTVSKSPRSTVGTVTEIYDYLRLLYANIGLPHCYKCGKPIARQTVQQIVDNVLALPGGTRLMILAPVVRGRKGEYSKLFEKAQKEGFVRVKVDGKIRELDEKITLKKTLKHDIALVVDRLVLDASMRGRLTDSVELALQKAEGLVAIDVVTYPKAADHAHLSKSFLYSEHFACPDCGISVEELTPRLFSFNSPYGACPNCNGLGVLPEIDPALVVPDSSKSILQGAIAPWEGVFLNGDKRSPRFTSWTYRLVKSVARHYGIDLATPFKRLTARQQRALLYGSEGKRISVKYRSSNGSRHELRQPFEGIIPRLKRRLKETKSEAVRDEIMQYCSDTPCPECRGQRLRKEALAVKLNGRNISQLCTLPAKSIREILLALPLTEREQQIGGQIIKEITDRLVFLDNVGLNYLTLDRRAGTLAGGEAQRIRLATQVGSQLVGVLYILDEPSIGLHQRDNRRLITTLKRLRDLGNTIIVVEHDENTIRSADFVIDLGPGAGRLGGELVKCGTVEQIIRCRNSITGRYLAGEESIPLPLRRRPANHDYCLKIGGAAEHNLKSIDVTIPLGLITCVTGVSGSGKSTLILDTLYAALAKHFYKTPVKPGKYAAIHGAEFIDKVADVDQSPIGRTPRSNPVTYTKVFDLIRELYAQVPESRMRGYKRGRFSFNVKGGRCEACQGDGMIKIEMHFLPNVYIECEECKGQRFNRETLEITYKGKTIADVLNMTVAEAYEFFANIPPIRRKLETLYEVGLGYITLGQSATTLSGGEAQRVKLSRELSKRQTGKTLYILDEPTTGLHFDDIKKLLTVLNKLVDAGNTVIIIEHNLDVIKTADYLIDLGPEGGDDGGWVVTCGTPEEVSLVEKSYTGQFLKEILARDRNDKGMS